MRKRVVWAIYFVSLLAGLFALSWLSLESIRLDQARETALEETERARLAELQAKQQIELQDRVGQAVWVLDVMLAPLIAQEATRPADVYQSFVSREVLSKAGPTGESNWEASPLFDQPSQYILLHFQISSDECWSSPQVPEGEQYELAHSRGMIDESFQARRAVLGSLSQWANFETLVSLLPQDLIQNYGSPQLAMNAFDYNGPAQEEQISQTYAYGQDSLRQFNRQQSSFEPQQAASPPGDLTQQTERGSLNPQVPSQAVVPQQRALNDLNRRNRVFDTFANTALVSQQLGLNGLLPVGEELPFGVTRPLWVEGRLILARQTTLPNREVVVQGCWLDWDGLQERMRADVAEFLPEVSFEPVDADTELRPSHLLATLPVQLSAPPPKLDEASAMEHRPAGRRPVVVMLLAAWIGFAVAAVAGVGLLFNAEALSERRAQFVSSVTHELRTPLTTFRMYTEMLKSGMVTAEKDRREYLETLHHEADRLTHLVENVLSYSRLEHGKKQAGRIKVSVEELMERLGPRLEHRTQQMGRKLDIQLRISSRPVLETDVIAVEQILANLVDNACKYGHAEDGRPFLLEVTEGSRCIQFRVCDHGPGVPVSRREAIFQPFQKSDVEAARTAPGIGLGLALSRRLATDLGGTLRLDGSWLSGACFVLTHPTC